MIEILRFTAEWCGPCKMMHPVFAQLSQDYAGQIIITTIDVDQQPEMVKQYNVKSIPTMLFLKNGIIADKQIGACPRSMMVEKIERLKR